MFKGIGGVSTSKMGFVEEILSRFIKAGSECSIHLSFPFELPVVSFVDHEEVMVNIVGRGRFTI